MEGWEMGHLFLEFSVYPISPLNLIKVFGR